MLYLAVDLLGVSAATGAFNYIRYRWERQEAVWGSLQAYLFSPKMIAVSLVIVLFWLLLFALSGYYNKALAKSRLDEFFLTVGNLLLGTFVEFLFLVVDDEVHATGLYLPLYGALFAVHMGIIYPLRLLLTSIGRRQAQNPGLWPRVVLVGGEKALAKLRAERRKMRFVPLAEVVLPAGELAGGEEAVRRLVPGIEASVRRAVEQHAPSAIYVAPSTGDKLLISPLLYRLYACNLPIKIAAFEDPFPGFMLTNRVLDGIPLFDVTATPMSEGAKNVKWILDRLLAALLLIVLSPLLAVIALLVRRSSPGKVFFSQERIGKGGKPFLIYKFRTMYQDAEAQGPQLSSEGDVRITPIGRVLRKYRLDELPQLYNVLKADMSFVGPRPERKYYIDQMIAYAPYYFFLHNVLPGITSWGMVKYGYASTVPQMVERLQFDRLYYYNMSLKLDLTILFYTVSTVWHGRGK